MRYISEKITFCFFFIFLFIILFSGRLLAQYETKIWNFPELGFNLSFYSAAQREIGVDKGNKYIMLKYEHAYTDESNTKYYKLLAHAIIYNKAGCQHPDSLVEMGKKRILKSGNDQFKITESREIGDRFTGWFIYHAKARLESKEISMGFFRSVKVISGKEATVFLDVICRQDELPSANLQKVVDNDTHFESLGMIQRISEWGIQFRLHGQFDWGFADGSKSIIVGQCGRLAETYPKMVVETDYSMSAEAWWDLYVLAAKEDEIKGTLSKVSTNKLSAETGQFANMTGAIYKLSYLSGNESESLHYFFTIGDRAYHAWLFFPFVNTDKVSNYRNNGMQIFDYYLQDFFHSFQEIK